MAGIKKYCAEGAKKIFLLYFTQNQYNSVSHLQLIEEKGKFLTFPDFQAFFPDFS